MTLDPEVLYDLFDNLIDEGVMSEGYFVAVAEGQATIFHAYVSGSGKTRYASGTVRGQALGRSLDPLRGPLVQIAARAHMAGFDALPDDVKKLVQEHGNRAHQLYDEGYEAFDIKLILEGK